MIDPPKRNRRRVQFRLRTLMIGITLLAVACGWLERKIEQRRREQEAVEAIAKLGGRVDIDYEYDPSGKKIPGAKPPGSALLRQLLGENFFSEVVQVTLSRGRCADAGLKNVKALSRLQMLWLDANNITDDGLVWLNGLTNLRYLGLNQTKVTDAGLATLKELTELQWLYLAGTQVTDAGVNNLQKALPNCKIFR
jgi:hypothetical protein